MKHLRPLARHTSRYADFRPYVVDGIIYLYLYIYECYYINNPKGDCWHSERFHHQLPCVLDIESRRIHSIRRKASNSQGSRHHWNHSQIRTHLLRHIVERNGQRTIDNYWYQMTMTFVCLPLEIGGSHFLYASTFFFGWPKHATSRHQHDTFTTEIAKITRDVKLVERGGTTKPLLFPVKTTVDEPLGSPMAAMALPSFREIPMCCGGASFAKAIGQKSLLSTGPVDFFWVKLWLPCPTDWMRMSNTKIDNIWQYDAKW